MFTIKFRSFQMSAAQCSGGPIGYDPVEQLHGPFEFVSQEMDDGQVVVYAHRDECAPAMTFGPHMPSLEVAGETPPRPTLWVMNATGATVARYDL